MNSKIDRSNIQDILELNNVQKGILVDNIMDPKGNVYIFQLGLKINGDIDPEKFQNAFALVQGENDSLRSVFNWDKSGKPLQFVLNQCEAEFVVEDVRGFFSDKVNAIVDEYAANDRERLFDIKKLPLRARLFVTGYGEHYFFITHHQVLYDGWSTALVISQLFKKYDELMRGDHRPATPRPISLKQLKADQNRRGDMSERRVFWADYLAEYESKKIFRALTPVKARDQRTIERRMAIGELSGFSAGLGVTKANVIYLAYGLLLSKYLNTDDVVFGTVVSARQLPVAGIESVIGNLISTVPLRVRIDGSGTLKELVERIHGDIQKMLTLQQTSYAEIKKVIRMHPNEDMFDSMLVVENYPLASGLQKMTSSLDVNVHSTYERTTFPLAIEVFADNEIVVALTCTEGTDFDPVSFIDHLMALISEIVDNPNKKLSDVVVTSDAEMQAIDKFNDTYVPLPEDTIVSLFRSQVERTPHNVAIRFGEQTLTFQQK